MRFLLIFTFSLTLNLFCVAQNWEISAPYQITKQNPISYSDNIEMAGTRVAAIIHYDIDTAGILSVEREVIFPQLRRFIKDDDTKWQKYRAYLKSFYKDEEALPNIYVNKKLLNIPPIEKINIDGTLEFVHKTNKTGIAIARKFFPSSDQRLLIEEWSIHNASDSIKEITIANLVNQKSDYGVLGKYTRMITHNSPEKISLIGEKTHTFQIMYTATKESETTPTYQEDWKPRITFLSETKNSLVLKTPDETLNTLFAFSKIRAAENIFHSKMGLVHSPGGGRYYAGVWANDQAEYSGPFFPYLGYDTGNIAAMNAYKAFYEQMLEIPNHDKNLWASYEMNGDFTCCGTDRGDAAMIAFGGLHFLMASGDKELCKKYEPMIDWCLEYNHKKLNAEGVVLSESDEMEGRIPTGTANLSTSALYYGALDLAIDFYKSMDADKSKIKTLEQRKQNLYKKIDDYFGAEIEGLKTYKYFKEHKHLRHWICLPLVMGINDRKEGTIKALFEKLWTENGVHVEINPEEPEVSKIFWDRGTLYALRGTFLAGATEISLKKLKEFSEKRLLGEHVPYVVEAYPEGNMAHLSAESALYCRVFLEGVFGIRPTGISSFSLLPRLPASWDEMSLEKVKAFNQTFDIKVSKAAKDQIKILVNKQDGSIVFDKTVDTNTTVQIDFK